MVSGGRQQSQNKFTEQVQWHVDTYCIMLHMIVCMHAHFGGKRTGGNFKIWRDLAFGHNHYSQRIL